MSPLRIEYDRNWPILFAFALNDVEQFFKIVGRNFLLLYKSRNSAEIATAEVVFDEITEAAAAEIFLFCDGEIVKRAGDVVVANETFSLEPAHHGGDRVEVRTRVGV